MWAQILNALAGLWLMISPHLLNLGESASDNDHIIGPIILSFSVIAWWEATRSMRLWNLPFAIWLFAAPWVLGYESQAALLNDSLAAAFVVSLSLVRGKIEGRYGGGWSALWTKDSLHARESKRSY